MYNKFDPHSLEDDTADLARAVIVSVVWVRCRHPFETIGGRIVVAVVGYAIREVSQADFGQCTPSTSQLPSEIEIEVADIERRETIAHEVRASVIESPRVAEISKAIRRQLGRVRAQISSRVACLHGGLCSCILGGRVRVAIRSWRALPRRSPCRSRRLD